MNFFHKLLNPHCPHCISERNVTIDMLKMELEKTQRLNEQLMARILEKPEVKIEEPAKIEGSARVGKPIMSWTARRQILEAESREAARKLSEKQQELSVEDIEKELGVANDN
jgi:hypothetical protein